MEHKDQIHYEIMLYILKILIIQQLGYVVLLLLLKNEISCILGS